MTQENKIVIESINEPQKGDTPPKVAITLSFSYYFAQAAAFFSRKAGEIETDFKNKEIDDSAYIQHWSFVVGAVVSSVSFLEAGINEIFHDCTILPTIDSVKEISIAIRKSMAKLWENPDFEKSEGLEKYQKALELAQKQQFDRGISPFQDVKTIFDLRHYLVHYKSEAIVSTESYGFTKNDRHPLEKRLINKFDLNHFTTANASFPGRYFGHGLAEWCVRASLKLTDEFYKRMEMTARYENIRDKLSTG